MKPAFQASDLCLEYFFKNHPNEESKDNNDHPNKFSYKSINITIEYQATGNCVKIQIAQQIATKLKDNKKKKIQIASEQKRNIQPPLKCQLKWQEAVSCLYD